MHRAAGKPARLAGSLPRPPVTVEPSLPGLADDGAKPDHKGHRERLRKRFLDAPEALPDYEILELLLGAAIPQKDTKPLAKALIKRFGSFADVITADVDDLKTVDGIKDVAAATLKVVREAAIRLARAPVLNTSVTVNAGAASPNWSKA